MIKTEYKFLLLDNKTKATVYANEEGKLYIKKFRRYRPLSNEEVKEIFKENK